MNFLTKFAFFAVVHCLVASSLMAQEDGPNQKPAGDATVQTPNATSEQDRGEQIRKRFFDELDMLIPGEFASDSPQKKGVEKAVSAFQQGDSPEATRQLQKLAKDDPTFPPIELLQAGLVFAAGNPVQGFKVLEDAALKNPNYPGIYFAFARLAIGQQRLTDAQALIEKAAQIISATQFSDAEAKHFRSQFYDSMVDIQIQQRKYQEARESLAKLEELVPKSNKIAVTKAELDFFDGDYESSYARLKDFNQKNPQSSQAELVMAQWFQNTGKTELAGEWIAKAAEAHPDNPQVQYQFASFAVNNNNFPQANSAIGKIESRVGETPETVLLKGKMAFAGGAFGMAEVHYKKLVELQPKNFDAANMYALALIESDAEEKQQLASRIAQQNYQSLPDNQIAQATFGWVLWRLGKKDQARQLLTRAARSPQLAPEVAYFLAEMMHELGNSQQAKLMLEPAMKTPGLFYYRQAADKLMKGIDGAAPSSLPVPGK